MGIGDNNLLTDPDPFANFSEPVRPEDGLTEERLVALLKRWSKAPWRKTTDGLKKMDQLD